MRPCSKQGSKSRAIGYNAGKCNQASNSIVISAGNNTVNGATSSAFYVKPIRNVASSVAGNLPSELLYYNNSTGEIGRATTYYNFDTSYNNIRIGLNAGKCYSHSNTIAIGTNAAYTGTGSDRQGDYSIAIGYYAGNDNQNLEFWGRM